MNVVVNWIPIGKVNREFIQILIRRKKKNKQTISNGKLFYFSEITIFSPRNCVSGSRVA